MEVQFEAKVRTNGVTHYICLPYRKFVETKLIKKDDKITVVVKGLGAEEEEYETQFDEWE